MLLSNALVLRRADCGTLDIALRWRPVRSNKLLAA